MATLTKAVSDMNISDCIMSAAVCTGLPERSGRLKLSLIHLGPWAGADIRFPATMNELTNSPYVRSPGCSHPTLSSDRWEILIHSYRTVNCYNKDLTTYSGF